MLRLELSLNHRPRGSVLLVPFTCLASTRTHFNFVNCCVDKDRWDYLQWISKDGLGGFGHFGGTKPYNVGFSQNFTGSLEVLHFLLAADSILAHCENSRAPVGDPQGFTTVHHFYLNFSDSGESTSEENLRAGLEGQCCLQD